MSTKNKTIYTQDVANNKMTVVREFAAPIERVWAAWTQADLLDQWWAPKPWKAETKSMNFKEGGIWLYSMIGPNGERHWSSKEYKSIDTPKSFTSEDAFTDESGKKSADFAPNEWNSHFQSIANGTKVTVEIIYENEKEMQKEIDMGFKDGFAMGHDNLDEVLKKG